MNIKIAEKIGFDYIEPSVSKIAAMDEQSFKSSCNMVDESSIKCESFNILFPKGMRLVGQDVYKEEVETYLESAFTRIKRFGARIVVFGSGGARKCPEGWDYEKAIQQLVEIARITGKIAEMFDIDIVIEPLNKQESNIINSVFEGINFVKKVNHPRIKLVADFYHMRKENENMGVITNAAPFLHHIHIANSNGRSFPLDSFEDIYKEFFEKLKNICYEGRISIEAKTDDFENEGIKALKLLRSLAV